MILPQYFQPKSLLALIFALVAMFLPMNKAVASENAVLLSVENGELSESLDRSALDALPQVAFETTTIWTEGTLRFSGPPLGEVLEKVGLNGRSVIAEAANDYRTKIPAELIEGDFPIVATRINGEPFGLRRKGPLWIVFPYDLSDDFQRELVFSSSVWQLQRLRPADE